MDQIPVLFVNEEKLTNCPKCRMALQGKTEIKNCPHCRLSYMTFDYYLEHPDDVKVLNPEDLVAEWRRRIRGLQKVKHSVVTAPIEDLADRRAVESMIRELATSFKIPRDNTHNYNPLKNRGMKYAPAVKAVIAVASSEKKDKKPEDKDYYFFGEKTLRSKIWDLGNVTKRKKAAKENEGLFKVDLPVKDLVNRHYGRALEALIAHGFMNIRTFCMKDVDGDSPYFAGELDHIESKIPGSLDQGASIPYYAVIDIYYHGTKELVYPYANDSAITQRDKDELVKEIKDIGFKTVKEVPIKDIKIGLFVKKNSVDRVSFDKQDAFKPKTAFPYNAEVVVYYHTK
ncbi:MAG: hypothetical protein KBT01_02295 [Clostridiales bacterium]|nr:hypothetical protein [Candidatus Blautia equi]